MDLKTSKLMEKLAQLKKRPARFSGYLVLEEEGDKIRLYPRLDPGCYYVFDKDCVLETIAGRDSDDEIVAVLLDPDCEIDVVSQQQITASDLASRDPLSFCDCEGKPDIAYSRKDDLRKEIIELAERVSRWFPGAELNCKRMDSWSIECCKAWNKLLNAVQNGGNTFDAENEVIDY